LTVRVHPILDAFGRSLLALVESSAVLIKDGDVDAAGAERSWVVEYRYRAVLPVLDGAGVADVDRQVEDVAARSAR
jgi:hypothetical protein